MTSKTSPIVSQNKAWVRGGLWSWAQIAVGAVTTVLQARIAVTSLEQTESGIWFVMLSFAVLINLMDFGLNATLARELAFDETPSRRAQLLLTAERTLRRAALIAWLALTALGGAYLYAITPTSLWTGVLWAWGIFVIGAGFALHANAASSALYGTGHISTDKQVRMVAQIVGVGGAYLAVALTPALWTLCLAWVGQNVVLWLLEWKALKRRIPSTDASFDGVLAQRLLSLGWRWWLIAVGGFLILSTDNLVIAATLGPDQVGDYALLARISAILQPLALVFVTSTAPLVSKLSAEGRTDEIRAILERQTHLALLLVFAAGAVIAAVPQHLLELWVGPGHFVGYPVLTVFLVMLTLEVHHVTHAQLVMATGKLPFATWAIGAGVLNIVLSLILVRWLGLLGVALGTMLAQLLTNNWFAPTYTLRTLRIPLTRYAISTALPALGVGITLHGMAQLVALFTGDWHPLVSVATVTLSVGTGAVLAFALNERRSSHTIRPAP